MAGTKQYVPQTSVSQQLPGTTQYYPLCALCRINLPTGPDTSSLYNRNKIKFKKLPQYYVRPYFGNFAPNIVAERLHAGWPWTGYVLVCPRILCTCNLVYGVS